MSIVHTRRDTIANPAALAQFSDTTLASSQTYMSSITVYNKTSAPITVFVSKYTNVRGSDRWYTLPAGKNDSWERFGWEVVAFKNSNDSNRAGVYVHADQEVHFYGMDHVDVV
ncbi:hypothetical protein C8Q79DRAFT_1010151 [Trametes meyenii]|nr:hypothetical protein C8Q79DRAFT_1010151 [Trametes meyenii]